jgi:hypothetical protein
MMYLLYCTRPNRPGEETNQALSQKSTGFSIKILHNKGVLTLNINDLFRMQQMHTSATFANLHTQSHAVSENRAVRLSFTFNFGNKQVKAERERKSGLEDEGEGGRGEIEKPNSAGAAILHRPLVHELSPLVQVLVCGV